MQKQLSSAIIFCLTISTSTYSESVELKQVLKWRQNVLGVMDGAVTQPREESRPMVHLPNGTELVQETRGLPEYESIKTREGHATGLYRRAVRVQRHYRVTDPYAYARWRADRDWTLSVGEHILGWSTLGMTVPFILTSLYVAEKYKSGAARLVGFFGTVSIAAAAAASFWGFKNASKNRIYKQTLETTPKDSIQGPFEYKENTEMQEIR